MNNFYTELPYGYKEYKVIDAENKKTMIWFTIVNILLTAAAIIPFIFVLDVKNLYEKPYKLAIILLVIFVGMIAYIVLHELTHGLFYKILTKQKLTYGFNFSVAFCGVPHIYVSKKTALFAVLAPFVIFTAILIPAIFLIPSDLFKLAVIIVFGIHFGGCVGDLYVTFILLKSKGDILMNDTGPKQTFYKNFNN